MMSQKNIMKNIYNLVIRISLVTLVAGFLFLSIRNYIMPVVEVCGIEKNSYIHKTIDFNGIIKANKIITVKAPKNMYIKKVNCIENEIMLKDDILVAFGKSGKDIGLETYRHNKNSNVGDELLDLKTQQLDINSKTEEVEDNLKHMKDSEQVMNNMKYLYEKGTVTNEQFEKAKLNYSNKKMKYRITLNELNILEEKYLMDQKLVKAEIDLTNEEYYNELNGIYDILETNENSEYKARESIVMLYVPKEGIIKKGDIIVKYCKYTEPDDIYIEGIVSSDYSKYIHRSDIRFRYWKNSYTNSDYVVIKEFHKFINEERLKLMLTVKTRELIYVGDSVNVEASCKSFGNIIVPKTAIIVHGTMQIGKKANLYVVDRSKGFFNDENKLILISGTILEIGDSKVVFKCESKDTYLQGDDVRVVNYASQIYENGMRVRVR